MVNLSMQDNKFVVVLWKLQLLRTVWGVRLGRCLWENILSWNSKSAQKMLLKLRDNQALVPLPLPTHPRE